MSPNPLPRSAWPLIAALVVLVGVAYFPARNTPFVFDDIPSLLENPTLTSLPAALTPPPGGITVAGRPLLNFSFALNYAISGTAPWSYHLANVAIHLGAALLLFGLVRRALGDREHAIGIAGATAALWALHPLQTESVTYTVQRAESLAALFILATLYASTRALDSTRPRLWSSVAMAACFAGVATKETAVVAPLLVVLHDRCLRYGSWRAALAARGRFYLGLASSWLLVVALVGSTAGRGGSAVFTGPATPWEYATLQLGAIAHYVRLVFWPHPLVFDYGPFQSLDFRALWPGAGFTVVALVATFWLLARRPRAGFLSAGFFVLLAPSSSVVPIVTQVAAEHRAYLAIAAVIFGLVWTLHRFLPRAAATGAIGLLLGLSTALTWQRNQLYASPLGLWQATATACPTNPRAHVNLGEQFTRVHRTRDAIASFEAALRIQPNYVNALYNLGTSLITDQRPRAALAPLRRALELEPQHPEAAYNLGNAYAALGEHSSAIAAFEASLRAQPNRAAAHFNLANSLLALDRLPAAIDHLRRAVALAPDHTDAHFNLANALFQNGQPDLAIPEYEAVLRLNPHDADAAANLRLARAATRENPR